MSNSVIMGDRRKAMDFRRSRARAVLECWPGRGRMEAMRGLWEGSASFEVGGVAVGTSAATGGRDGGSAGGDGSSVGGQLPTDEEGEGVELGGRLGGAELPEESEDGTRVGGCPGGSKVSIDVVGDGGRLGGRRGGRRGGDQLPPRMPGGGLLIGLRPLQPGGNGAIINLGPGPSGERGLRLPPRLPPRLVG